MGRIIWGLLGGSENNVAHIYCTDRGDVSFRIRDAERYVDVAKIPFTHADRKIGQDFYSAAAVAFAQEFLDNAEEAELVEAIKAGRVSPYDVWESVKKTHDITALFDCVDDVPIGC